MQASLAAARSEVQAVECALASARRREAHESLAVKSEASEQLFLEAQLEKTTHATFATRARFSEDLDLYQEQRERCAESVEAYGRSTEEHRNLLDALTDARERCALGWRGLDEDEAQHVLLAQQLDVLHQRQFADASAAASEAALVLKGRVTHAASEHAVAAQRCSRLAADLKEAEDSCTQLSRALEQRGNPDGLDTTRDRALREDDAQAIAYLAKVQAASSAAGEAAAQSAGAVGAAEEEVGRLTDLLSKARKHCAERSHSLTLAVGGLEQSRTDQRRAESELDALEQEVGNLRHAREVAALDFRPDVDRSSGKVGQVTEAELWASRESRERRTETLPREQMLLLQLLRGSQRGGAGAGSAGSSALEALRDLREQQLLEAQALSSKEDLLCAELQNSVEAEVYGIDSAEKKLRIELEPLARNRESLLAKLENGQEAWPAVQQELRKQIQQLKGEPEAKEPVDDDTVIRMGVVMQEAQRFLGEQQLRLDAAEKERDEIRNRLLDTLGHLEGQQYAELVVATAIQTAASERPGAQPDAEAPGLPPSGSSRRPPRSPVPFQPSPTIPEEDETAKIV